MNRNNIDIVQLLIEYATTHSIILYITDINRNNQSPIFITIAINNKDMTSLLLDYAKNNHNNHININDK